MLENKDKKIDNIFTNKFTFLDKQLTEISSELASAMAIVLHLRHTYHGLLHGRRGILFDIVLYLSDRAKIQVNMDILISS